MQEGELQRNTSRPSMTFSLRLQRSIDCYTTFPVAMVNPRNDFLIREAIDRTIIKGTLFLFRVPVSPDTEKIVLLELSPGREFK